MAARGSGPPPAASQPAAWPPRLLLNTDGNWINNYQERHEPADITRLAGPLRAAGVDMLCALIGIDDDLSWRGSPHGQLWCDNVTEWNVDGVPTDIHGHPITGGRRRAHPRPAGRQHAGHQRPPGALQHDRRGDRGRPRPVADLHRRRPRQRHGRGRLDANERRPHRLRGPDVVRTVGPQDRAAGPADRLGPAGGRARHPVDLQLAVGLRAGRGAGALPGHHGRGADPLRLRRAGARLLAGAAVLQGRRGGAEHPHHDRLRAAGARDRAPPLTGARARAAAHRAGADQHRRVAAHRPGHAGVDPRGAGRHRRALLARLLHHPGGHRRGRRRGG